VVVEKYESLSAEGEKYGIVFTPTILVDDKVVAAGRGVSEKEIEKFVRHRFENREHPG
jgi:protein-disulfide isomerase